jgi:hypothetical protein
MAPPLTGSNLIRIRQSNDRRSMKRILCSLLLATLPPSLSLNEDR